MKPPRKEWLQHVLIYTNIMKIRITAEGVGLGKTRTSDLRVNNTVLFLLSYCPMFERRGLLPFIAIQQMSALAFNQLKIRVVEVEDSNLTCGLTSAALTY